MKRLITIFFVIIPVLTLIGSCSTAGGSTGDYLALPKVEREYQQLQSEIDKVLAPGGEFAAPTSGYRRQSVQLEDLNNDGIPEAIVFMRTAVEKTLKVCLFVSINNEYSLKASFEGEGSTFDSVYYYDFNSDGYSEILVGRSLGSGLPKALSVLSVYDLGFFNLLTTTYTGYSMIDIDEDDSSELILVLHDISEMKATAEVYRYSASDTAMLMTDSVALSSGSDLILRIKSGFLTGKQPALFITSQFNKTDILVDICAFRGGKFSNITMNDETGISVEEVKQFNIGGLDINNDSIFDLPKVITLTPYETMKSSETFRRIVWRNYTLSGRAVEVLQTYQNNSDGWYFILPESWYERVTVDRRDYVSGERTIVFSIFPEDGGEPIDILSIYTLTGDNKTERSRLPGRFIIQTPQTQRARKDAIFAGYIFDLPPVLEEFVIIQDFVLESFKLIQTDWLAGELTA